jgi:hypothetical protein
MVQQMSLVWTATRNKLYYNEKIPDRGDGYPCHVNCKL